MLLQVYLANNTVNELLKLFGVKKGEDKELDDSLNVESAVQAGAKKAKNK